MESASLSESRMIAVEISKLLEHMDEIIIQIIYLPQW